MVEMIKQTFLDRFEKTFKKREPKWPEVAMIFSWLKHEASCARKFEHLETIDDLRRITESTFSEHKHLEKKVDKESQRVNEAIRKRDEQLRTIASRKKGKVPLVEGEKEEEKIPPNE
jgi:hypothetical protein